MTNMGLLPAELVVKAVRERMTLWALHAEILEFERAEGDGIKEHLVHTKNWCIATSLRGTSRQSSKLAV